MFSADVFYSEVVHHEREANGAGNVLPQTRRVWHLVISMGAKALSEELIGQNASLGQPIDGFTYFNIYLSIFCVGSQIVLVDHVLWKEVEGDCHIFVSFQRSSEVKFLISMHIYFASSVLTTLFQRIFDVVRSAVHVVSSPG